MTKKKAIIIAVVSVVITNMITILLLGLGTRILLSGAMIDTEGVSFANIEKYNNVRHLLKTRYVDVVDDNELMEGSIKGLAEAIDDPYTEYMNKDEFENMKIYTSANYAGIGIVLGVDPNDNLLLVSEVFDNSPAKKANMMPGDKIIKVFDTDVDGDNFDKAVQMIRGPKGTEVQITVFRKEVNNPIQLTVARDEIEIITVKSKMLEEQIGYIRILQFGEKTSVEFKNVIEDLKNRNMKKLIIDLRDNPGGLLDEVVGVSEQLISKRLVVYTVEKNGKRVDYPPNVGLKGIGKDDGIDIPLVVLINERSASASEILAAVVKDYNKGLLIGQTTYGKGVVQSVFPLADGSGVKITTSKYYTPNGVSIHEVGVKPDIVVELEEKYKAISKLTSEEDLQLKRAIEELKIK